METMDDNIKITGGIKMGQLSKAMESLRNNGIYGKVIPNLGGEMMKAYDNEHGKVYVDQDPRYNIPKSAPKASEELVEETVVKTEIYRRAKLAVLQAEISPNSKNAILEAQRKQVAYGIDKYPEPLNANTWSISETVDHIMDESIDKLHYLIMLSIKLENELASYPNSAIFNINSLSSRINRINHMINNAIDDLDYLVALDTMMMEEMNREAGACNLTRLPLSGADFDGDTCRVFSDDEMKKLIDKGKLY